jgi:Uncharacterized ACR, COG1678
VRKTRGLNRKLMLKTRAVFASCLLLVGSMASVHAARDQPYKGSRGDKALFLVARPELRDPIFKESVVLMFPSSVGAGEGLVVGLIVNKPARLALSEIFPNDKALENRSETAYFGGPVDQQALGVVFRSSKGAKQGALLALLFDDVYVSFDADFIKGLFEGTEKNTRPAPVCGALRMVALAIPKRDVHESVVRRVVRNEPDIQP